MFPVSEIQDRKFNRNNKIEQTLKDPVLQLKSQIIRLLAKKMRRNLQREMIPARLYIQLTIFYSNLAVLISNVNAN